MQGRFRKVLEDEDQIELLQSELDTFQRGDLNLAQGGDKERRVGQMYETLCCRLQADVGAVRYTFEREFPEGNVDFKSIAGLIEMRSAKNCTCA